MIEVRRRGGRPWRIGHKGAAALAPENTLASLERAVAEGVDAIEFDVLALTDGTLVLAHSDDLRELTHGAVAGRVGGRGLAELRELSPELPTFEEALAYLDGTDVGLQVDLKWHGYEREAVEALRRHGLVGRTLVSSFHARSLREVGRLEPGLRRGLTYPYDRFRLSKRRLLAPATVSALLAIRAALPRRIGGMLERTGATVATLHYLVATRAAIRRCHALGAAVWVWTVDDPRAMRRLAAAGVDGVISNDPALLAATLPG
ncbi:MAG TPA: glycerophosphodiester phosphodiesterase [Gaiellaceae bacterium]|nr:glycerophosphodiester phosphodiesterase [Gaiellaceae bacterium]